MSIPTVNEIGCMYHSTFNHTENGSVNISEAMEGHGLNEIHTDTSPCISFLTPSVNRSDIPIELFPSSISTDTSSDSFIKQHGW
jgi:hypothetical protein